MVPRLRAPIVLVHGLLGFDCLRVAGRAMLSYFPGIPGAFEASGNRVLVPCLSPTGGVAQRAAELKSFIDSESPAEPVHLLAHSLGGLDARYMISRLGMAPRVLSLTTLGTPHRGSSFADWGVRRFAPLLKPFLDFLGVTYQAFYDLTVASCSIFNEETLDAPGVRYFSVAGQHRLSWRTPQWHLPARLLERLEGDNDGIVSVSSARYGESCEIWECDHLELINWCHPLRPLRKGVGTRIPQYASLVQRLKDEGF